MIDSVKISIPTGKILPKQKSLFYPELVKREYKDLSEAEKKRKPTTKTFYMKRSKSLDEQYIPPSIEIYEYVYTKKKEVRYNLKVEFSVGKLINENNLFELKGDIFNRVVKTLIERLALVGVIVNRRQVINADISKVHFGKNIILPSEITMSEILKKLAKVDMNKNNDITRIRWRNADALHFYSGSREMVFYDKALDMQKPKNRRESKDMVTDYEKYLVNEYSLSGLEIFRYEYRLNKYPSVQKDLNPLLGNNKKDRVYFKDLFNEILWDKIINGSWKKVFAKDINRITLFDIDNIKKNRKEEIDFEKIFRNLLSEMSEKKTNHHGLNEVLQAFALIILSRVLGIRQLRSMIQKYFSDKTAGERLNVKIINAGNLLKKMKLFYFVDFIEKKLKEMKTIKEDDFKNML